MYLSGEESLNSLNIPVYDRHQQVHCRELFTQMSVLVCDLVQGLSNWYTYTEQRIKIYPLDSAKEPITEVSKKVTFFLYFLVFMLKNYSIYVKCR